MASVSLHRVNASALARSSAPFAAVVVLAVCCALARARAERLSPTLAEGGFDIPAFPAEVVRPFSFGLRAMDRLLTYSTDLDPAFAGAYRFAGNAMPRQTTDGKVTNVLQAEALLSKGVRERGDDWHIPFTLGFLQSYFLGSYADAGRNFAAAA